MSSRRKTFELSDFWEIFRVNKNVKRQLHTSQLIRETTSGAKVVDCRSIIKTKPDFSLKSWEQFLQISLDSAKNKTKLVSVGLKATGFPFRSGSVH